MKIFRHIAVLSMSAVVVLSANIRPAQARTIVVDGPVKTEMISLHPGEPLVITLKSAIIETNKPRGWAVDMDKMPGANTIKLFAPPGTRQKDADGKVIVFTRRYTFIFWVKIVDSADKAPDILVEDKDEAARLLSMAKTIAAEEIRKAKEEFERRLAAKEAEFAAEKKELLERIDSLEKRLAEDTQERGERELLRGVHEGHKSVPIHQEPGRGRGIHVYGVEWVYSGKQRILRFMIQNRESNDVNVADVEVINEFKTKDHAGPAAIGEDEDSPAAPVSSFSMPGAPVLGVVKAGKTSKASVLIRDPGSLGRRVTLVVNGPKGILRAYRVVPVDPPILSPRQRRARQVSVGVQLRRGAFWHGNGTEQRVLDSTSMTVLGVRAVKGLHENWAVTGEVVGGKTGEAYFDGVSWRDMEGEVRRRATFGRITVGGVYRLGRTYVPFVRLGAGVQATSHDSTFITGGTTMDGPGASFEVDGIFTMGAGLDIRLGRHWLAGVGASFDKLLSSDSRSVGAGIYIGYAGNP